MIPARFHETPLHSTFRSIYIIISILLAGNIATEKQRYGTLAACMDGRVIIQTFSSHDYHQEDVERLWMNYIYNTLLAHFQAGQ